MADVCSLRNTHCRTAFTALLTAPATIGRTIMPNDHRPENETFEATQRAPLNPTAAVVWRTDAQGSVTQANPSWEAFTGQPYSTYAGLGWLQAIHADDQARVIGLLRTEAHLHTLIEISYRLRRKDGEYRELAAQAALVSESEAVREWVGICIDITVSRQAEAALKAGEERLRFLDRIGQGTRALTDATSVMAVTARLLGEYLQASRCAYADVDADSDRFTIRSDWSVQGMASSVGVYSLELFGSHATSNLRQGLHLVVHDVDRELTDDNGGRMFNAIGIKAIICAGLVKDGRLVALMAVHQNMPRPWTEQDIAIVAEVVDRSWAHIERVRDNAKLREQDRRKDEFLATLAHELRNPLAPMKYAIALMRRSSDPAQISQAQDIVDRQATHMARLIDDLLDVSRINEGRIHLRRQPVALQGLILQALEMARPAIEAARHRLTLELPDSGVQLDADGARIVQTIDNLLTNAAKYTPEGGQIHLSARPVDQHVEITVTDTGIGIPVDQLGRIFERFSQLPHSAGRANGGLGIGLSLVKDLVEMHGGTVHVHSAGMGTGSTFMITLPLSSTSPTFGLAATPQASDVSIHAPQAMSNTSTTLASPAAASDPPAIASAPTPRVLIVEDNPDGLDALVDLLDALGYPVAGAQSGPQALELAERFHPQIVLLDLGMPVMDGFEVARALRAHPRWANIFIIALTGWGGEQDRARTAQAGFDGHLTKPVEPGALEDYLQHAARQLSRSGHL